MKKVLVTVIALTGAVTVVALASVSMALAGLDAVATCVVCYVIARKLG